MMKKCVVTGASGFLGADMVKRLSADFEVIGLGHSHAGVGHRVVDLRIRDEFRRVLEEIAPDVVVHGAAFRDPDFCEDHPDQVRPLNVGAVETLVETLPAGAKLVLISSDYVFDGKNPPYAEDARRCPVNEYGRLKVEAEDVVARRPGSIIVRTPLMVGAEQHVSAPGFIGQTIEVLRARQPAELDNVLIRFPTWTWDVACAVAFLLERRGEGVFHVSGPTGATRYELTLQAAAVLGVSTDHLTPSTRVVPRRAARPDNSQLAPYRLKDMGYAQFTEFRAVVEKVLPFFGPAGN